MSLRQFKYNNWEYNKFNSNSFRTVQQNKFKTNKKLKCPNMAGGKGGVCNTCGMVRHFCGGKIIPSD